MLKGRLTYEDLPEIYEKLSADLPTEGIEHVTSTQSRKGYDTTGYGYQFCVNRMNEVIFGHWRDIPNVVKEEVGKTSSGKPMYRKIVYMTIQIGNWHFVNGENVFEVLAQGSGYGGHESLEESSAYKGAYTNAFKKAAAMLGVGKKAFEGTLDEDLFSAEAQELQQQRPQQQSAKKQQQRQPQQKKQQQENPIQGMATPKQLKAMFASAKNKQLDDGEIKEVVKFFTNKESSKELTSKEASDLIEYFQNTPAKEIRMTLEVADFSPAAGGGK